MRSLTSTPVSGAFDQFTGPSDYAGIRLAFRNLPESERRWMRTIVSAHSRTDSYSIAARLGVREPVAAALIKLLHPQT